MKRLIISLKNFDKALGDFKTAFKAVKQKKLKQPHFEISFDNKVDFDRFVCNIHILKYILVFKPRSVYELAKLTKSDISNLNKVILFFEEIGAIKVKNKKLNGRQIKTPSVPYDTVEFDLAA